MAVHRNIFYRIQQARWLLENPSKLSPKGRRQIDAVLCEAFTTLVTAEQLAERVELAELVPASGRRLRRKLQRRLW